MRGAGHTQNSTWATPPCNKLPENPTDHRVEGGGEAMSFLRNSKPGGLHRRGVGRSEGQHAPCSLVGILD